MTTRSFDELLARFATLGREERMQTLLAYAKRLEPVPPHLLETKGSFSVPECQTRVDIFPEIRDGRLYFYSDVDPRQSPTIAAFLSIVFSVTNGQLPQVTLDLPTDLAGQVMAGIGLRTRQAGLDAIVGRLRAFGARAATEGTSL